MRSKSLIYLLLILGFYACERKIEWDIKSQQVNAIVIESIITNEYKHQEVKLTKPFSDLTGEIIPVSSALVTVSIDDASMQFIESDDKPGHYFSKIKMTGTIDKIYILRVQFEDQEYTAQAYMIPVIPLWPLQIVTADSSGIMRKIVWTAPPYDPEDLAMYQADIDWTHLAGSGIPDTITRARLFRYTLNTIDVNYVILPQDKEEVLFPAGSILIVRKFSVTDEYGAYLRALLSETEWQGSLFEEIRGNLPTNISNGGLGYFSACSVVADTIVVQ